MRKILAAMLSACTLAVATPALAEEPPVEASIVEHPDGLRTLVHEAVIDASPAQVWATLATEEGWKSWGVAFAKVDLRPSGTIETGYYPDTSAGDPRNIVHRILTLVPEQLMVTRVEQVPEGGPIDPAILEPMWAVYELEPLPGGQTLLRISGHGYGEGEDYDGMLAFFRRANIASIEMMRAAIATVD